MHADRRPRARNRHGAPWALSALTLALSLTGCQPGIHWSLGRFEDVHPRAVRDNRLTFVYFRDWWSQDCTDFEENVLKQSAVLAATTDMVCIPLDFSWDARRAADWGIDRTPGFVIVDPAGNVLEMGAGPTNTEELLAAIARAKGRLAGQPQAPPTP